MNVAVPVANELGLAHWDGECLNFVDHMLDRYPEGEILYVGPIHGHQWTYHVVLVLDGITHDPWYPEVMLPPEVYVGQVFGEGTPWELNPDNLDDL